jgi:membrane protein DedA with SNARE-associated domain
LLTGLNIPFSEDLIIISCAIIAASDPNMLVPFYIAIYLGVVISDHMVYWIGHYMHKAAKKTFYFTKMLNSKKFLIIQKYLNKHGLLTFIVCRFIPFGIRNLLFMSCGFSRMNYKYFSVFDIIAATINTSVLYFGIYFLGLEFEKPFKALGIVMFAILILATLVIFIRLFFFWKEKKQKEPVQ